MKIGAMLAHLGTGMSPAGLIEAARRAEELGYAAPRAVRRPADPSPRSWMLAPPGGAIRRV